MMTCTTAGFDCVEMHEIDVYCDSFKYIAVVLTSVYKYISYK